jgi:hypothetical protein
VDTSPPPPRRLSAPPASRRPLRVAGTGDALLPFVARKLTMLATVVVMPGGLFMLCAVACVLVLMRSDSGRRVLVLLRKRIPPRVKAPLCQLLRFLRGEQLFRASSQHVPLQ